MKKLFGWLFVLILVAGAYGAWQVFGPVVSVPDGKYFYIRTGSDYNTVKKELEAKHVLGNTFFFNLLAKQLKYEQKVKAGRYEIRKGMSTLALVRMLRSGNQAPVNFVITKLRLKEDLAQKIAANFETDSASVMQVLNDPANHSKYGVNGNTIMTTVIPNSYSIYWNSSAQKIMDKLYNEKQRFWTPVRLAKAKAINMTPEQVYTMASIVEEETNKDADRGKIASVYMNRIATGMRLEADPTIKFALRNFSLKRIWNSHKEASAGSPYNTYYVAGLPPGPICTPSSKTIDAVLNAPQTNYIFFVAKPDWSGLSNFSSTYAEHLVYAKNYQRFLDSVNIK